MAETIASDTTSSVSETRISHNDGFDVFTNLERLPLNTLTNRDILSHGVMSDISLYE